MSKSNSTTRPWLSRALLGSIAITAAVALGRFAAPVVAESAPADKGLSKFMRQKLDASSKVLEGLATEDAALIREGTKTLLEMSKSEVWNVIADADYREFDRDFRSAVRKLDEAAEKGNFDNVTLQWFGTVKSCVECHKYVRSQRPAIKK
jgi:cytochrome c556